MVDSRDPPHSPLGDAGGRHPDGLPLQVPDVFNQVRGQRSRTHVIQIIFLLATVFLLREAMPLIFWHLLYGPLGSAWREITGRRLYKATEPEPPVRI